MKKFFLALALVAVASTGAFAQRYNRASWGIMGGFTYSSANIKHIEASNVSNFHIGLTAEIPLMLGFAIQPSVLYQTKGTGFGPSSEALDLKAFETKVAYLEVPVQVQWGIDLGLLRPYALAEPFVGLRLGSQNEGIAKGVKKYLNNMEYGLGVGAGVDVWKLQLSVKYFWNLGSVYDFNGKEIEDTIKDALKVNNFNGVTVSLAVFF